MDQFHHVSSAFLQLAKGYQEAIEEITRRMGAGMAKFVCSEDLKEEEWSNEAVQCLNEMITNALKHAKDSLKYMSALHDPAIFRFCAIPQVSKGDPHATETLNCVEEIQRTCRSSGLLGKRRIFTIDSKRGHEAFLAIVVLFISAIMLAIVFNYI